MLRCFNQSPPYHTGGDIPRPLAGLDLSPLFLLCCLRVLLMVAISF